MKRVLVIGAAFFAGWIGLGDEPRPRPSGNASIRGKAGSSEIVITATDRLAGAIHSLTWGGKEFIDGETAGPGGVRPVRARPDPSGDGPKRGARHATGELTTS